ncbi:MAG: iron export ABC transporter permease subunit FetB [Deltaproteobacteria bacterium]|nr:iron export ABC transporter permease subunit FetB [Deltaproteobacteria bacterium]
MNVVALTPLDLVLTALLVLALALLSLPLKLEMFGQLLVAGLRMTAQLLLIGLILKWLFTTAGPWWIVLLSLFMLLNAGREVTRRQKRRLRGWWGFGIGSASMFLTSFPLVLFTLILVIGNQPWYEPRYAIPLLGMLLGNTMNGISIGFDRLLHNVWQQRQVIENRLMLGQSWFEALAEIRRESIRAGMMPIINAMMAAGIIVLPGMMTGQILAGSPPLEAVKYQIMIMFLIVAGAGFGTVIAVYLGGRRLFDSRQRLRLERLS